MITSQFTIRAVAIGAMAMALAACGGGGYDPSSPPAPPAGARYVATNLVSDVSVANTPGTGQTDAHLVNPWGIAFQGGQSSVWVTNNGSSTSTLFNNQDLTMLRLIVAVPAQSTSSARPTGAVFNSGNGFAVTQEGRSGIGRFIFASEGGTLSAWAPTLGLETSVLAFDSAAAGAMYTGLVKTTDAVGDVLFAADFHNRVVDGFDANFRKFATDGGFVDADLPAGYAPFGIQAIGALVYVAYARQDAQARAPVSGAGLGLVNIFDNTGHLLKRLIQSGGPLDAPWGMAIAPANFGVFSNALLVANSGDGKINAFDAASGRFLGTLTKPDAAALAIDGLRGLAFGNGASGQPTDTLFFTAGPGAGRHGIYGRINNQ